MSDLLLNNKGYDILEKPNGDCYIKEKESGRFFFKKCFFASRKYYFDQVSVLCWGYKDTIFTILIIFSFYLLWFSLNNTVKNPPRNEQVSSMWTLIFIFLNVILHEAGHAISLIVWGRYPGRIRFKWYYIFPLISVDTSDIYIMPKYRGMFVCYAGVMVNIYLCALVVFINRDVSYILLPIYTLILFSLIPFSGVKTDGYNLLIRLAMGINDIKGRKSKLSKFLELSLNVTLIVIIVDYVYGFFS